MVLLKMLSAACDADASTSDITGLKESYCISDQLY